LRIVNEGRTTRRKRKIRKKKTLEKLECGNSDSQFNSRMNAAVAKKMNPKKANSARRNRGKERKKERESHA